jgi:hypothetical protein
MNLEKFLSDKLHKISILDMGLIKIAYLTLGLLLTSIFFGLQELHWGYFLALIFITATPLYVHLFSLKGPLFWEKYNGYLKTNNPSNQVLLLICMLAFAGFLAQFFPVLISFQWHVYLIVIIVFVIKPFTKVWFL